MKLLAIDDNRDNLTTLKAVITDALPGCSLTTALNGLDGIALAEAEDPDVILLDIVMPVMDGFETCSRLKANEHVRDIPVLFLTALRTDPKSRMKAIDVGAEGFLSKPLDEIELIAQVRTMAKIKAANRLQRMEREQLEALVTERTSELEHELAERKRAEQKVISSETRFRRLFEAAKDGILILDAETGAVMEANPFLIDLIGTTHDEICGKKLWELGFFRDVAGSQASFRELQINSYIRYEDLPLETADGRRIEVEFVSNVYPVDDSKVIQCNIRDITQRKKAEQALLKNEERLNDIIHSMVDWVWETDEYGVYTYSSRIGDNLFVQSKETVVGMTPFDFMPQEEAARVGAIFAEIAAHKAPIKDLENWNINKNGERICILTNGVPILDEAGNLKGYRGVDQDITERKKAEQEKALLESQLQQAQKMDSVGRLAGGVAHDFNNMLGVIIGNTQMAMEGLEPTSPLYEELTEVSKAAERSADLTRSLLAFARKQTVTPKVIDLNHTIDGMLKMLQRMIGENIQLNFQPQTDLWQVKVDPSQVDQIMANLCVNARDAITDVGFISIKTDNAAVDDAFCATHADISPGEYVRLTFSDNGCGMDSELQSHIFEPFFTTKGVGEGTGLGLSSVYGAVKQNNGFINVDSKPGHGTTFTIYISRHISDAEQAQAESVRDSLIRGNETILLVEDEPAIMRLGRRMLEHQGYQVLGAVTPDEAIRLAEEHTGEIHLLLTDVVMPEMNGRDLARRLLALYPNMQRLFMSGYTADVIAHNGVLDDDVHFLQKPFTMQEISTKVRQALTQERHSYGHITPLSP